jgi:hypothetical protein
LPALAFPASEPKVTIECLIVCVLVRFLSLHIKDGDFSLFFIIKVIKGVCKEIWYKCGKRKDGYPDEVVEKNYRSSLT